jgi:hypothetical protein
MVGERGITPLLGELYAKALIKIARQKNALHELPNTIPGTMVRYVENIGGEDHRSRDLLRVAKRTAWECLRKNFRPGCAEEEIILKELANTKENIDAQSYPEYLEQIGLIERLSDSKVRFTLDPLAEYLAAIYVVELLSSNELAWTQLLKDLGEVPGAPGAIAGFLIAISDSIRWKSELGIPDWVAKTLGDSICRAQAAENQCRTDAVRKPAKSLKSRRPSTAGRPSVARAG